MVHFWRFLNAFLFALFVSGNINGSVPCRSLDYRDRLQGEVNTRHIHLTQLTSFFCILDMKECAVITYLLFLALILVQHINIV